MEYSLQWQIPKCVLLLYVSGDITIEELVKFNQDMNRHLDESPKAVHVVSVGNNIRRVPTNLMRIKQTMTYLQHPHMGWTILVQEKPNPLTGFLVSVATQATGMKIYYVKYVEDSVETLKRLDPALEENIRVQVSK
jgi:hypothetical protein